MIVRCKKIYNEITGKYEPEGRWPPNGISNGREYIVLEIHIEISGNVSYRVESNDKLAGIYDAKQFDIVSCHIPSNWGIHTFSDCGHFKIGPKAWAESFWENYYDSVPGTHEEFERQRDIIVNEEPSEIENKYYLFSPRDKTIDD